MHSDLGLTQNAVQTKIRSKLNSMPPFFSIVTVCLNAGAALRQTAETVLAQNFGDFEYIIKDGGSTDGSLDSLPRDPRIRIFRSPDCGIFDAMNQALEAATGRFVHFLNAGDFFIDNDVLGDFESEIMHSEDTEFFYGDVIFPGLNREHVCYPGHLTRYFLFTHMICHQAWFVSRLAYLRLGKYKLDAKIGSDQVFLYDALLGELIRYRHVPRFAVRYDIRGVSSNPAIQEQSRTFREGARCRYYPSWERHIYSGLWKVRSLIRSLFILPPLLKIFRWLQRMRHGCNL